jgi:hypothetical protein
LSRVLERVLKTSGKYKIALQGRRQCHQGAGVSTRR